MGWDTVRERAMAHRIASTAKMRPRVRRYVIYASRACWGGAWSLELCTSDWPAAECTLTSAAAALPCPAANDTVRGPVRRPGGLSNTECPDPRERRGLDECAERCPAH